MTNTYRLRLMWVTDTHNGVFAVGHNHTTAGERKRIDRRIKRRQHNTITREAVESYYADGADTLFDYLFDDNWNEQNTFWEPDYDEVEDYPKEDYDYYDPMDDYIDDGWASYHYDDGLDYWGSRPVSPEDKRFIEREDIGKSLGEILEEIRSKNER